MLMMIKIKRIIEDKNRTIEVENMNESKLFSSLGSYEYFLEQNKSIEIISVNALKHDYILLTFKRC